MRSDRLRVQPLRLATASAAAAVVHALWIRPRMLRWGATPDETSHTYPGDELVPDPDGGATMATPLPALPENVWPWLVQMGGEREGWCSWDRLDNDGRPSTDRIVPEWQNLEVGQHLQRPPKGPTNWWTLVILSRTAPWCCKRATARPANPFRNSGPARCLGHTPRGLGASTFAQLPRAGPA